MLPAQAELTDRELGQSGNMQTLLSYPVLVVCNALASDLWWQHRPLVLAAASVCALLGLLRHWLGKRLCDCSPNRLPRLKAGYFLSVLAVAACWSIYSACVVSLYGRSWTGLLSLLVTIGITAASTSNLVPHEALLRLYVMVMIVPSAWMLASFRERPEMLTALLVLLFAYFLNAIGRRNCQRHLNLLRTLRQLDEAHQIQEGLLSRWNSLAENAPDIVALVDPRGALEWITRQPGEARSWSLQGLVPAEMSVGGYLERIFDRGESVQFESGWRTGKGWYSFRLGPVTTSGRVESAVLVISDISSRRQLEQELRQLSARQQESIESERLRLSREVHDELGQLLTALKIELARLERQISDDVLMERVESLQALVDSTMGSVRRIASRLRPPLLDELGLGSALEWLAEDFCGRSGLGLELKHQIDHKRLSPELSLTAFRLVQESLTNVVRHARASRVQVRVESHPSQLGILVQDDGCGIPNDAQPGLGLLGFRERVRQLGGTLRIEAMPEGGTAVEALLPLNQE